MTCITAQPVAWVVAISRAELGAMDCALHRVAMKVLQASGSRVVQAQTWSLAVELSLLALHALGCRHALHPP